MRMDIALPDRVAENELHRFTNMQLLPWLKKLKDLALSLRLPVGTIVHLGVDDDPADIFGYGEWEEIAQGRVLVGLDDADPDFDELGETGGSKTHSQTSVAHLHEFNHTHTTTQHYHTMGTHSHTMGTHEHTSADHIHSTPAHAHDLPLGFTGTSLLLRSGYSTGTLRQYIAYWDGTTITPGSYYAFLVTETDGSGTTGMGGAAATTSVDPGDTNPTDPGDTNPTNALVGIPSTIYTGSETVTINDGSSVQPYEIVKIWKRVA